jgi:hypothetical protein
MKTIVILLFAIVVQITCLQTFSADFEVTASSYNNGFFNGQLYYDWANTVDGAGQQYAFILNFPVADEYSELYVFNNGRGYSTSLLNGQFSGQYLYRNSSHCACETTSLLSSMPLFFLDSGKQTNLGSPMWTPDSNPAVQLKYDGVTCSGYTLSTNAQNQLVTYLWLTPSQTPCGFTFSDGRTFTLSNVQSLTSIPNGRFQPPVDCKCGKPIDVVLSLDRTGSIQIWEWYIQHNFTQNLCQSFDYGPLKTNLGIVDWNSNFWVTLDLTVGISADIVNTAVNAMGCCVPTAGVSVYASCCCCGTPIGGGLYYAGQMMLTSTRATATKVIILLTDGCQNHMYDPSTNPPTVKACVCSGTSEQSCETDIACIQDISTHYQEVVNFIPGVKIIVVGVGGPQQICTAQLADAAGGISSNIFQPQSWSDLTALVQSISATACDVEDKTCTGCCGICSCGSCIKPINCSAPNLCTSATIDISSNCCSIAPITCAPRPCFIASCDNSKGCLYTPIPCPAETNCSSWSCDNVTTSATFGICTKHNLCTAPMCVKNSDCNDNNPCTNDLCIKNNCSWTPVTCGVTNNCTTYTCDPLLGCQNTTITCNDFNMCTKDTCVGSVEGGCVFTEITCNKSLNRCFTSLCSPAVGCYNEPVKCNLTTSNCTVTSCANNTCGRTNVCVPPPPPAGNEQSEVAIIGGTIGAAALAGICIGAVALAAGLAGGGAAAFAHAGAGGGMAAASNNPLYQETGHKGVSPLYKPA